MKRTGLHRRTALRSGTPPARLTPLARASAPLLRTPPRAKLTSRQRKPIVARSGFACEIALPCCTGAATDVAHRLGEGMGGRSGAAAALNDRASNVLHACRSCHRCCQEHPAWARDRGGWMLRTGDDPRTTPVLYRHERWVLLDDAGGWTAVGSSDWVEAT